MDISGAIATHLSGGAGAKKVEQYSVAETQRGGGSIFCVATIRI